MALRSVVKWKESWFEVKVSEWINKCVKRKCWFSFVKKFNKERHGYQIEK